MDLTNFDKFNVNFRSINLRDSVLNSTNRPYCQPLTTQNKKKPILKENTSNQLSGWDFSKQRGLTAQQVTRMQNKLKERYKNPMLYLKTPKRVKNVVTPKIITNLQVSDTESFNQNILNTSLELPTKTSRNFKFTTASLNMTNSFEESVSLNNSQVHKERWVVSAPGPTNGRSVNTQMNRPGTVNIEQQLRIPQTQAQTYLDGIKEAGQEDSVEQGSPEKATSVQRVVMSRQGNRQRPSIERKSTRKMIDKSESLLRADEYGVSNGKIETAKFTTQANQRDKKLNISQICNQFGNLRSSNNSSIIPIGAETNKFINNGSQESSQADIVVVNDLTVFDGIKKSFQGGKLNLYKTQRPISLKKKLQTMQLQQTDKVSNPSVITTRDSKRIQEFKLVTDSGEDNFQATIRSKQNKDNSKSRSGRSDFVDPSSPFLNYSTQLINLQLDNDGSELGQFASRPQKWQDERNINIKIEKSPKFSNKTPTSIAGESALIKKDEGGEPGSPISLMEQKMVIQEIKSVPKSKKLSNEHIQDRKATTQTQFQNLLGMQQQRHNLVQKHQFIDVLRSKSLSQEQKNRHVYQSTDGDAKQKKETLIQMLKSTEIQSSIERALRQLASKPNQSVVMGTKIQFNNPKSQQVKRRKKHENEKNFNYQKILNDFQQEGSKEYHEIILNEPVRTLNVSNLLINEGKNQETPPDRTRLSQIIQPVNHTIKVTQQPSIPKLNNGDLEVVSSKNDSIMRPTSTNISKKLDKILRKRVQYSHNNSKITAKSPISHREIKIKNFITLREGKDSDEGDNEASKAVFAENLNQNLKQTLYSEQHSLNKQLQQRILLSRGNARPKKLLATGDHDVFRSTQVKMFNPLNDGSQSPKGKTTYGNALINKSILYTMCNPSSTLGSIRPQHNIKNQFVPYTKRVQQSHLQRSTIVSNVHNDVLGEIKKIPNVQIANQLRQTMPSFGLYNNKESKEVSKKQQLFINTVVNDSYTFLQTKSPMSSNQIEQIWIPQPKDLELNIQNISRMAKQFANKGLSRKPSKYDTTQKSQTLAIDKSQANSNVKLGSKQLPTFKPTTPKQSQTPTKKPSRNINLNLNLQDLNNDLKFKEKKLKGIQTDSQSILTQHSHIGITQNISNSPNPSPVKIGKIFTQMNFETECLGMTRNLQQLIEVESKPTND